jgi:hypothetical protein
MNAACASVTIDICSISPPSADCSSDEAEQYIINLQIMAKLQNDLANEPLIDVFKSQQVIDKLTINGLYRDINMRIPLICKKAPIADTKTINMILRSLTSCPNPLENLDSSSVTESEIEPKSLLDTINSDIHYEFKQCIALIAVLNNKEESKPVGGHSLLSTILPKGINKIQTHALIQKNNLAKKINHIVPVCRDLDTLFCLLDAVDVLLKAKDDDEFSLAIRIAIAKKSLHTADKSKWKSTIVPIVGPDFRRNCQEFCSANNKAVRNDVLEKIVLIATELIPEGSRPAKESKRGGPVVRDGKTMFRFNISNAYRIHYWYSEGKSIELKDIQSHRVHVPGKPVQL